MIPLMNPVAITLTEMPSGALEKQTEVICSGVVTLSIREALIVCNLRVLPGSV